MIYRRPGQDSLKSQPVSQAGFGEACVHEVAGNLWLSGHACCTRAILQNLRWDQSRLGFVSLACWLFHHMQVQVDTPQLRGSDLRNDYCQFIDVHWFSLPSSHLAFEVY